VRAGTSFLITLLLLCGAAIAADAWFTSTAEEQASQRVGAVLGAPTDVELRGWPVTLRLLQGTVPEVGLVAQDVELEGGVRLQRLEADVQDVRITFAELRGTDDLPIDGGSGTFRAELSQDTVAHLAGMPGGVELGDGLGRAVIGGQPIEVVAAVEGGLVVFRPVGAPTGEVSPVALALPPLPGAAVIEAVRIEPGVLVISGRVLQLTQ
jgi:hypothetical protein